VSEWPPVWLLFVTYKRTKTALRSIASLKEHLCYPNLHWHIADDGSGEEHLQAVREAVGDSTWHTRDREDPQDFDVGGNINRGMEKAKEAGADICLMNFDDFALVSDLDLRPMVDVLDAHTNVGFIRLAHYIPGLAGVMTYYHAPRMKSDYIWFRLIREWTLNNPWLTDSYIVSIMPYVAHTRFFNTFGQFSEKKHPGETEVRLNKRYIAGDEDEPQILYPVGRSVAHAPYRQIARRQRDYREAHGDIAIPRYVDTPILDETLDKVLDGN